MVDIAINELYVNKLKRWFDAIMEQKLGEGAG